MSRYATLSSVFIASAFLLAMSVSALAQVQSIGIGRSVVKLKLLPRHDTKADLLLLSDLVEMQGSDSIIHVIRELPVAPSPRMGKSATWSRDAINKLLAMRGISEESIQWSGPTECQVTRVEGTRKFSPKPSTAIAPVQSASASMPIPSSFSNETKAIPDVESPALDRSQFTPVFTTPTNVSMAQRLAADAINDYLKTKTNSNGRWIIQARVPTEHAKLLSQRNRILSVGGGQPPWEGEQEFVFLIKAQTGEQAVPIQATVRLPDMVAAVNRPLAKGYILKLEDLSWIPMPTGLKFGSEDCFSDIESLIGQQLRRSMSTQQVVRLNEVGPPTVVHVGDIVQVEVVSGDIVVGSKGRAIEAGGMDDLVQVELDTSRSRVLARITGDKKVEVISNGPRAPVAKTNNQVNRK
jgi:flagellar basal body P-ring formation protein FlgA